MSDLLTEDFDFPLDESLIAQHPSRRRDESRLMVLRRPDGEISHHRFADLPGLLLPDDVLVLNDTRVLPAKFACLRATGGRIEGLFCHEPKLGCWEVMLKGANRCKPGEKLTFERDENVSIQLEASLGTGRWNVSVNPASAAEEVLARVGATALPPYIHRGDLRFEDEDRNRYQTVYADRPGAVAAPTAGLHFTAALFEALSQRGVETAHVTLHVGPGTFAPVKTVALREHKMHSEWFEITEDTARSLNAARQAGRRVVAVGTTSVRVLESAARQGNEQGRAALSPVGGWTDIFLYPPAEFRAVDALITNFHLPKSTLLMLVAAYCSPGKTDGLGMIHEAYRTAVREGYRFYSYGDAMLIL